MTREEFEKRLNERNEATKVWIQAETQARAYAHELEKERDRLREVVQWASKHAMELNPSTGGANLRALCIQALSPSPERGKEPR